MGTTWVPGAERLTPRGPSSAMAGGPAKVVVHTTEGGTFASNISVLTGNQAEPHLLYDPATDRLGQFYPLDVGARSLKAGSGTSKNRDGTVVIQVEVIGYARDPFTSYWHPGPGWQAVLDAAASWGVPDVWPAGPLSTGGEAVSRSSSAWRAAGWFGHCNVPDNDHWDPGGIDQNELIGGDVMGDVNIVGMNEGVAGLISKQVWERYSPGGKNLATHLGEISANLAWVTGALQDVAAATGVTLSDPPPPLEDEP